MRIGIVGHGSIGRRHAANARALGHEVKVYDPANVRDFSHEHKLYDWCEAAVIATPTLWHEGPLRACIERGKHALVEKPLSTLYSKALADLISEAKAKGLTIMMGNNLRFHDCVKVAKEKIERSAIAPVWAHFTCATPPNQNEKEGVILSSGAHEVDVATHLFGPVDYVAGASARYTETHDDVADFTLVHKNGVRSSFHLDFITELRTRDFWISGGDRHFYSHSDNRSYRFMGHAEQFPGSYDDDYVDEMRSFVDHIGGKETSGATGQDGLDTLRVLLDVKTKAAFQ